MNSAVSDVLSALAEPFKPSDLLTVMLPFHMYHCIEMPTQMHLVAYVVMLVAMKAVIA